MSHALDILDGVPGPTPWRFTPPAPTVLIIPCTGDDPPALEDVLQPIADFTGQDLGVQSTEPPEEAMHWFAGCTIEGLAEPLAIWCQPLGDLEEHVHTVIGPGYNWFVAIQTVLSTHDPMTNYINLVRLISASIPDAPVGPAENQRHFRVALQLPVVQVRRPQGEQRLKRLFLQGIVMTIFRGHRHQRHERHVCLQPLLAQQEPVRTGIGGHVLQLLVGFAEPAELDQLLGEQQAQ